ncbi:hypothetical protein HK405_005955 [Cladochytrium tenue]|nr:hypothetical protein HK405_005955 [Cladochytrium tenue]
MNLVSMTLPATPSATADELPRWRRRLVAATATVAAVLVLFVFLAASPGGGPLGGTAPPPLPGSAVDEAPHAGAPWSPWLWVPPQAFPPGPPASSSWPRQPRPSPHASPSLAVSPPFPPPPSADPEVAAAASADSVVVLEEQEAVDPDVVAPPIYRRGKIGKSIGNGVKKAVGAVKNVAKKAVSAVKNVAKKAVSAVKTVAKKVAHGVKKVAAKAGGVIKTVGKIATKVATVVVSNAAGAVFGPAAKAAVAAGMTFVGDLGWGLVDGKNIKTAAKDAGINAGMAALDGLIPGAALKNSARTTTSNLAKKAGNWRSIAKPRTPSAKDVGKLARSTAKRQAFKDELKAGLKEQVKQQKEELKKEVKQRVKAKAQDTFNNAVYGNQNGGVDPQQAYDNNGYGGQQFGGDYGANGGAYY